MENQKALKKVSDKDLRKVFLHSLAIMCSWNYERQMHMGFMYGMAPVLDKLYASRGTSSSSAGKFCGYT